MSVVAGEEARRYVVSKSDILSVVTQVYELSGDVAVTRRRGRAGKSEARIYPVQRTFATAPPFGVSSSPRRGSRGIEARRSF